MAKSQKEKLEVKLEKAKAAGDAGLVKAIQEELVALAKAEGPVVPAVEPVKTEPTPVNVVDERRKAALAGAQAMGPNPLKRFRVVAIDGGYAVVNPDPLCVVSPLDKPLEMGEANKLCSSFNSQIKPPKEALKKAGSNGTLQDVV